MLMCDFESVFTDGSWAKYYIFIYSVLLYCTLIFLAFLQKYPVPKFVVIVILHILFLCYVAYLKPFVSNLNNIKSITNQVMIIGLCVCDMAIVSIPTYQYNLELGVAITICIILVLNVVMYVLQVIVEYSSGSGQI